MSWKSLVCAGLLCALAMPVTAAPTVTVDLVRSGGIAQLDANGDWQWEVSITPDGSGSIATELAFMLSDAGLVSVTAGSSAAWDHDNPGADVNGTGFGDFSWLTLNGSGYPEGLQSDVTADEVYIAVGSADLSAATVLATIVTEGPATTGSLTTSIEWGGAYSGDGVVAQGGLNYTFSGSASATALPGDATLNGDVEGGDLGLLLAHWSDTPGQSIWSDGDFTGNGDVEGGDLGLLLAHWSDPPATPPAAGAIVNVPEPATAVLLVLGALLAVARIRR